MKFTLSWLKDHLETDASLETIVETLTMIGLEVESVDDRSALKPFVIARVHSAESHPDADRLKVLQVDAGDGQLRQVVCGAPNAREGLVGAFAAPGTIIPGTGLNLTVGMIRGVESNGMMCSERELMLSDEHDGIIDLPADAPVGKEFSVWANLDDPVLEIGLTPNRPDCTGVYGIARDLAAAGLGTLKTLDASVIVDSGHPSPVSVTLEFSGTPLCLGFALRKISGVKNGPSPKWLQRRLHAIGLRPINALVDVTNYLTFDCGRPLHVFDADKVAGKLVVRRAQDGESLLALDGREYKLTPQMCVISDENGVESLAGIIGGERTGCDESTTNVLVESALWEPLNIARTGRELGIITDARYRFERGVDPQFMAAGLEIASRLITEFCGGRPEQADITGWSENPEKKLALNPAQVGRVTGVDVAASISAEILERLGFKPYMDGDNIQVTVPSWRPDIDGKADLVEEVMRIHGVDKIEPQPMPAPASVSGKILTPLQNRTRTARRALAVRGMIEQVSWSFVPKAHAERFGGGAASLRLANPIAAEMSDMRPSLLPGLLVGAQKNADRGQLDLALFEISDCYSDDSPQGQRRVAAGLRRGTAGLGGSGRHWSGNAKEVSVFDAKADALAVIEACGLSPERIQVEAGGPPWYHPGRSATLRLGPKILLGYFGELHPNTLREMDVTGPLSVFEIQLEAIPALKRKATRTKPRLELSGLQPVKRDFAFVVDEEVESSTLIQAAASADRKLVAGVTVFDVFEGASIGKGKKSVGLEIVLQPRERTLTETDLEELSQKIVENVKAKSNGRLRD